jgi:hypothetical protein
MRKDILENKEQLLKWINENQSKAFICRELDCKPTTLDSYLLKIGIVYRGNMGLKGKKIPHNKMPISYFLINGSLIGSYKLKNLLFDNNIKEKKCENCGIIEWDGKEAPLELHHIDGNKHNNELKNIQILCPNCHAQTNTNSGKSGNRKMNRNQSNTIKKNYCECGKEIKKNSKRCPTCDKIKQRKVKNRPTKEELVKMIKDTSLEAVGRKYGISGNAVKKWLK